MESEPPSWWHGAAVKECPMDRRWRSGGDRAAFEADSKDVVPRCAATATTSVLMTTTAESPILVLGATGGQGGAVTAALLARQARVRAMVRRPGEPSVQRLTERGVEVMVGSLEDRAALGAAMKGSRCGVCADDPVRGR